ATVTLVSGVTAGLPEPAAVDVVHVTTAEQMKVAVDKHAPEADAVVMSAAVADFRPSSVATAKIKKGAGEPDTIGLVKNEDILAGLVRARDEGRLRPEIAIVGFAAETGDAQGDVLHHARAKLARKRCDLLVVNAVGEGRAFEVDSNDGWLLGADGSEIAMEHGSKALMASRVLDALVAAMRRRNG
ncbi:MAG: phosphopantothenoylcysteine decarboxylase, partial [Aldersonia sp.]|nr:phosphopantothenoylcysteine decarboxylase [Aldersonia sp.]